MNEDRVNRVGFHRLDVELPPAPVEEEEELTGAAKELSDRLEARTVEMTEKMGRKLTHAEERLLFWSEVFKGQEFYMVG